MSTLIAFVLLGALGAFGTYAATVLISDRKKKRGDLVGGIKVARAIHRLEAGEREAAAGQLSAPEDQNGTVGLVDED